MLTESSAARFSALFVTELQHVAPPKATNWGFYMNVCVRVEQTRYGMFISDSAELFVETARLHPIPPVFM